MLASRSAHRVDRSEESPMPYVDGFVLAVPVANRDAYLALATKAAAVFRKHGALRVVECWGDDVPEGTLTSFTLAVQRKDDEAVVFSWIEWPSREARAWPRREDMTLTGRRPARLTGVGPLLTGLGPASETTPPGFLDRHFECRSVTKNTRS
jgi:uncharacterized protein YbaA (DUF1428 family)